MPFWKTAVGFYVLPWSRNVSASDWAESTQLWNGMTQKKHHEWCKLNFAVGFEEIGEKRQSGMPTEWKYQTKQTDRISKKVVI